MIERYIPGPYFHRIVETNGILFFSGLAATDKTKDMKGQTEEICQKADDLLAEVGLTKDNIVSALIYLTDFSQKDAMNEAWTSWLNADKFPARATLGIATLTPGTLIEIVITASR